MFALRNVLCFSRDRHIITRVQLGAIVYSCICDFFHSMLFRNQSVTLCVCAYTSCMVWNAIEETVEIYLLNDKHRITTLRFSFQSFYKLIGFRKKSFSHNNESLTNNLKRQRLDVDRWRRLKYIIREDVSKIEWWRS